MAKFDYLIKDTKEKKPETTGGKFDYLINKEPIQPTIQKIEAPQVEQPSKLTQIAGGIQESIGGTGETIGERLFGAAKTIGKKVLTAGAELVAQSRPAQAIADIQAGMKPIEALKKSFIDTGDTYFLTEFGKRVGQRKVSKEEAAKIIKDIERKRALEVVTGGIGVEAPKIKAGIEALEIGAKKPIKEVAEETLEELVQRRPEIAQEYPLVLKEIPLKTKMGDVAEIARQRGFEVPEFGVEAPKGKFDRLIKEPTEVKPTGVAPTEIKPVEVTPLEITAETKVSGLAKGVEEKAIENKLTQGFGDLPEYQTVNKADQAAKASKLLIDDLEKSKRIAMGAERPPEGVLPESIFIAVENHATKTGDVELLRRLATQSELTTQATAMGQRISMLAERNPDSAISNIQKVVRERATAFEKKTGKTIDVAKQDTIKEIKTKIKQPVPTKETWDKFITDITC